MWEMTLARWRCAGNDDVRRYRLRVAGGMGARTDSKQEGEG